MLILGICPAGFKYIHGYDKSLDFMIMMRKQAVNAKECKEFCDRFGRGCHSITWNELQKTCILGKADESDVVDFGNSSWKGWVTCIREGKEREMIYRFAIYCSLNQ